MYVYACVCVCASRDVQKIITQMDVSGQQWAYCNGLDHMGISLGGKEGNCWCCSFQWWKEVGGMLKRQRGRENELLFWDSDKKWKKKTEVRQTRKERSRGDEWMQGVYLALTAEQKVQIGWDSVWACVWKQVCICGNVLYSTFTWVSMLICLSDTVYSRIIIRLFVLLFAGVFLKLSQPHPLAPKGETSPSQQECWEFSLTPSTQIKYLELPGTHTHTSANTLHVIVMLDSNQHRGKRTICCKTSS